MTLLLLLARRIWHTLADYPQPNDETPDQTIARMSRDAEYAEANRRAGGRTHHHVQLMHEIGQQRITADHQGRR